MEHNSKSKAKLFVKKNREVFLKFPSPAISNRGLNRLFFVQKIVNKGTNCYTMFGFKTTNSNMLYVHQ